MIDIIITADYEIFGNGTGDVRHCVVKPTAKLLAICEEFDAKLTLFFEIAEYWAFQEAEAKGQLKHLDYSPHQMMRQQAVQAVRSGHDVQLHLHPQWLASAYSSTGWQLNYDYWRLPNVPHKLGGFDDILSLRGLLERGKHDLEAMLKPTVADYECVALRAGGSCIQPAGDVMLAMKEVGLLADSSVFKGGHRQDGPFDLDFRAAYSNCLPWRAHPEDINRMADQDDPDAIWEIPIFARQQRQLQRLSPRSLRRYLVNDAKRYPCGCDGSPVTQDHGSAVRGPLSLARSRRLFEQKAIQWDYCNLGAREMWGFLGHFLKRSGAVDGYVPLVMIGHPKAFRNEEAMREFLMRVSEHPLSLAGEIRFSTLGAAVKNLTEGVGR